METTTPHPHSKLMLIITIVFVVLALGGVGFYAYKIGKIKSGKKQTTVATTVQTETNTETNTEATTQPTVPTETNTPAAQAAEVKKDLSDINVSEIKQAVADLKTQLGAFNR